MADSKTSASYVAGDDPETLEANRRYQEALQKLTASIDQRKNRLFDPVWLSAAQGFLAPGAPDFFESLGRVAGNVQQAQLGQEKEERDIAQQQLDVAGRGLELQRQKQRQEMARRFLAGEEMGAVRPSGGAAAGAPSGTPSGALAGALPTIAAPTAAASRLGYQVAEPERVLTGRQYIALGLAEGKPLDQLVREAAEIDRKNLEVRESGVFNRQLGTFSPTQYKTVKIPIYGRSGTYEVPESVAMDLERLRRAGDQAGYENLAQSVLQGFPAPQAAPEAVMPSAPGAAPAGRAAPPAGLKSVGQQEIESERAKALAKASTEDEIQSRRDFRQRSIDADDNITLANQFRRLSEDPNASKMLGILNNQSVASNLAKLIETGIGAKDFRIGIPAIQEVMRNSGLTPEDQAKYRVFLYNVANMRLQLSKYMKGSVSNFEQELMGQAAVTPEDNTTAVRMKADLITRRAQFDRQVYRAWKDSKMDADEFLDSEDYRTMRKKYNEDLTDIAVGSKMFPNITPPAGGGAAARGSMPLPPGMILDKKTNTVRMKKQGE